MFHKEAVKKHFDHLSSIYSQNYIEENSGKNYDFRKRLELVMQEVSKETGCLLDCACGTGEITSQVLDDGNFSKVVICDISQEMLEIAKSRLDRKVQTSNILFEEVDIFEYIPDKSFKFDVILCLGLLAHTGELKALLQHLKSMLDENGKIFLQSSLLDHWGVKFTRFFTSKIFFEKNDYKISYFTREDIEKCAQECGLIVKKTKRYNLGIPFGDRISKSWNFWAETHMEKFAAMHGSDAIFVISRDDRKK